MANPILLLVFLPILAGLVNLLIPRILQKLLTVCVLLLAGWATYLVATGSASVEFSDYFQADRLAVFGLIGVQLLSLIILIFALKGVDGGIERRFFVLYPITAGCANGALLSADGIAFLIFWGLSGLTLYLFALLGNGADASQSAKKTFILVGGSDALLILGLALIFFPGGAEGYSLASLHVPMTPVGWAAFLCLLSAAFAKAGGFPLHTWVPSFSKTAPIESVALLPASLDKLLGIYLLTRMMTTWFETGMIVRMIVMTLGTLTVITAVMMALIQHDGRRLLGYHAVSQVGYMILGVGSGSPVAIAGGLFHLINNTIYKSNLFLTLGSVEKQTGTADLDRLGGLANRMPATFAMALIGALSISGIPPFNGFFSKWMIYQGLLDQARSLTAGYQLWILGCLVLAVFGSALTLASFLKFLHAIYLGRRPRSLDAVKETSANQWIATGLLAILCIGFGLFAKAGPIRHWIAPILSENGMALDIQTGLYGPKTILLLMAVGFVLGLVVFLLVRKTREDDVYLGGMDAEERFRVTGVDFYREIRNMTPFRGLYANAEKGHYDPYETGTRWTFGLSGWLQKAHSGELHLYLLYIVIGLVVLLFLR
jgi:formate hydrogenlyase subunit 3/multisubunit Na+/H+ antiporter MnhD subunit